MNKLRTHGDRGLRVTALIGILLVAGGAYLWFTVVADDKLDTSGPSMRPTLKGHGRIAVDGSAYAEATPEMGDIVVLQAPARFRRADCRPAQSPASPCATPFEKYSINRLLKRVVAGPGDSVAFAADGTLIRNGRIVDEPYIRRCPGTCALPKPITVPEEHYFVAGDNRPRSSDSRFWGPVPLAAFDGRVSAPDGR